MVFHRRVAWTLTPEILRVDSTVSATGPNSSSTESKYKNVTCKRSNAKWTSALVNRIRVRLSSSRSCERQWIYSGHSDMKSCRSCGATGAAWITEITVKRILSPNYCVCVCNRSTLDGENLLASNCRRAKATPPISIFACPAVASGQTSENPSCVMSHNVYRTVRWTNNKTHCPINQFTYGKSMKEA